MNTGLTFAIVSAFAFGIWMMLQERAAVYIHPLFGAIIVFLSAVVVGAIIILPQLRSIILYNNSRGIVTSVIAGLCVLVVDYYTLKAYRAGLPITVGGPVLISGSIAITALGRFILGESVTLIKSIGLIFCISRGHFDNSRKERKSGRKCQIRVDLIRLV